MKKVLCSALCILLTASLMSAAEQKKRVAVLNFDFGAVQNWWGGQWDIGKGIADLIVDELVKDGTYSVIERKQLDTILAEQNFSNSDRADASTAAKIGKVLGVNVIIVGSVTQFGTEKKDLNVGALAGRFGGFGAGKVGTQKGKANVAVTARAVDVNTAEILTSATGKGQSQRSGVLLGGLGAGGGGIGGGEVNMGSSEYRETILGEATYQAVGQVSRELIGASGKIPTTTVEIRGLVADVSGDSVILNVGTSQGVQPGTTLKILRVTRVVKDPATGKVLREITEQVGQVRISEADAGSSSGKIVSGNEVKTGDLVRSE
jgi:curli biogenesis system outer membrane secretion channel CsgG